MEYKDFVQKTKDLLDSQKSGWECRYNGYAADILANEDNYINGAGKFRIDDPLVVYSSISKVKDTKRFCYDLRFAGQSVGNIVIGKDGIPKLNVSKTQAANARNNFGFHDSVLINDEDWPKGTNTIRFRNFYKTKISYDTVLVKSNEHKIESLMLKEFSKSGKSEGKLLRNIQPVTLGKEFFQLTTPLSASNMKKNDGLPEFVNCNAGGGGIDILARVVHKGIFGTRLAVIELKDENKDSESQKDVMFQALAYATFVACLLRSGKGKEWWQILRNSKIEADVPEDLHLDVVTLMPKGASEEGSLEEIKIDKFVTLHPYTLYYELSQNKAEIKDFTGTLKDDLKA